MIKLLEKRNGIYGFCAIWIVLFHVFRKIGMPYIPVITNVVGIGNMAVDVFFFFSGICLSLSVKKHNYTETGWHEYYRRRFFRVIVPYLIICIPYYLWSAICESSGGFVRQTIAFIVNLSSVSFWLRGTQTTWFLYGIVVFYLLFPLLYDFFIKNSAERTIGLLICFIALSIVTAYVPVLKNSLVVWARLPIFTIGVIAGTDKYRSGKPGRLGTVFSVITITALGFLTSFSEISDSFTIPQVYRLLLYIPMTLALLILISKIDIRIRVLEWIGGLSLEIYLIHITLLHPIRYYGILEIAGNWLYLILPVVSVLIAYGVSKIEDLIQGKNKGFAA